MQKSHIDDNTVITKSHTCNTSCLITRKIKGSSQVHSREKEKNTRKAFAVQAIQRVHYHKEKLKKD